MNCHIKSFNICSYSCPVKFLLHNATESTFWLNLFTNYYYMIYDTLKYAMDVCALRRSWQRFLRRRAETRRLLFICFHGTIDISKTFIWIIFCFFIVETILLKFFRYYYFSSSELLLQRICHFFPKYNMPCYIMPPYNFPRIPF